METLSLPEPAASLLRRTGAIIDAAVLELTGQARAWVLGGGTVLAARWRHRASKDADITVREGTGLGAVYSDVDPTLARAMARAGALEWEERRRTLRVTFEAGRIEIVEMNPAPPGLEATAMVDGRPTTVLATAQILTGKAGRGLETVERDVFDCAVAAMVDRAALGVAVNALDPQTLHELCARTVAGAEAYRRNAPEEIVDPAAEWRHLLVEAPERTVEALQGLATQAIGVERDGAGLVVKTVRGDGSLSRAAAKAGALEATLEGMGGEGAWGTGARQRCFGAWRRRRCGTDNDGGAERTRIMLRGAPEALARAEARARER